MTTVSTSSSAYWLAGFSRNHRGDADADEARATGAWYRDLLSPIIPPGIARTLDVGCGTGRVVSVLAQLCPSAFHVAIDGTDDGVVRTEARMRAEGITGAVERFDVTDTGFAQSLRLRYGRFDFITCFFVLHHYPTQTIAAVLAALRDLLAVGGTVVLAECHDPRDDRASATERTCEALARLAGQPADLLLTPAALAEAALQAGFAREDIRFEARPGQPFTESERAQHRATIEHLRARVSALGAKFGCAKPSALVELETVVETMTAYGISGPARHAPTLAILRRRAGDGGVR